MNCEECRRYPEAGEPCPVNICPDEGEAWPLPALTASTGNIYAADPVDADGFPSVGIAWIERESPHTVPVQRDAYLHEIVKRCNSHEELVRTVQNLLDDIAGLKSRDDLQKAVNCERSWFSVVRALDLLDNIRDAQQQN